MAHSVWPKAAPLLILAGLCAYANCYPKAFTFDDEAWVVSQPLLDDPAGYMLEMDGRPLLAVTNLAVHQLGRNNPLGHHILNVLVHLAATLTLYGVVRRALLSPRFGDRYVGRAPFLAFAVALLWMLHPLQVQCVTYIIQRGEAMAGLFYLLVLYAMQRADAAADTAGLTGSRFGWYALSVVSLVLGFGSKEILVTAPGAVILFDRIFLARSVREMVRRRWPFYLVFLLVWGGLTGWHLVRASGVKSGLGFGMETVTPTQYALTESGVLLYYLKLSVWPRGLAIDYQGWPWAHTWAEAMPEVAIILGLLALTAVLLFWRPAVGFVCAWFFLILLPTSSFMPIVDAVFEHRMYLSLASPMIGVVFLGDWLLWVARLRCLRPAALAAAAVALGVLTFLRNEEYRTAADVWEVAVGRMPDSVRARSNLAAGLIGGDRTDEAIPVLERALELSPTDPTALQNLGAAHEYLGNYAAAAEYFRRLTEHYVDANYWRLYAANLLVLGRWEEAADAYARGIELKSEQPDLHYGRAAALYALGRDAEAEAEAQAAAKVNPDWPEAVLGAARSVVVSERRRTNPDALRSAKTWAELGRRFLDDMHPQHLDTLALIYAAEGNFARAIELSSWAVLKTPGGPWGSLHRDRLRYYRTGRVPWE